MVTNHSLQQQMDIYNKTKGIRNRKHNRFKEYDYNMSGYYFVTICVNERIKCLGDIHEEQTMVNERGKIVDSCWLDLPNHYENCLLGEYVIMPNHLHGIIMIDNDIKCREGSVTLPQGNYCKTMDGEWNGYKPLRNGYKPFPTKQHGLSEIIRGFKTFSSKKINKKYSDQKFQWQKSFYDRIIRHDQELDNIRQYIQNNPKKWELDEYYC